MGKISLKEFSHIIESVVGHGDTEPGEAKSLFEVFNDGMNWFGPGFGVANAEVDLPLSVFGSEVGMFRGGHILRDEGAQFGSFGVD